MCMYVCMIFNFVLRFFDSRYKSQSHVGLDPTTLASEPDTRMI